jgi:hypothetical protein
VRRTWLLALVGCGRIAFDRLGDGALGSGGGFQRTISVTDAATTALPVGYTTRVPLDAIASATVRADLADVQVLDGNGTEIPRVIDGQAGALSALWFPLAASIAPGMLDSQYTLIYGNPADSNAIADGTRVFQLYDDFAGSALGLVWLVQGSPQVANGELTLLAGTSGDGIGTQPATDGVPTIASVEFRVRITDLNSAPNNFYYWFGFQTPFLANPPYTNWVARSAATIEGDHATTSAPCNVVCPTAPIAQTSAYRIFRVDRLADRQVFWADGSIASMVMQPTTMDIGVEIRNYAVTSAVVVDWVRARGIADPEPTVVLGPEQPR